MAKLHNTIKFNAPPDKVWAVLGDLTKCNEWVPGVTSATLEGMKRVCKTADGNEIREDISDYSEKDRTFRYAHTQVPLPVRNSRGKFTVKAEGPGSLVIWDAEFEVLDSAQETEVTRMIDGFYKQTLESLRKRIEG